MWNISYAFLITSLASVKVRTFWNLHVREAWVEVFVELFVERKIYYPVGLRRVQMRSVVFTLLQNTFQIN